MKPAPYDVAVVGGGPAGCATAIALRRLGVERVVVVEAGGPQRRRPLGESIPPDARPVLDRLGVTARFLADGHEPCLGSCSAWGGAELGYNDFLFNPHGHGWHLDRAVFDASLAVAALEAGAEALVGWDCKGVAPAGELRLTHAEHAPKTLRARFVVDATGRRSRVARVMGARQLAHDRLTCVAGFMRRPPDSRLTRLTMLEAVEDGWWYAARLPGDDVAVAVASDPDLVKRRSLSTREGWLAALSETTHLSHELAGCSLPAAPLVVRTAPSFVLDRATGSDWLAVGDAAACCDPLSSQGIQNALDDGLRAAEAIVAGDLDAYDASIAARFERYLRERNFLYGLERRWPGAPFWSLRVSRSGPGSRSGSSSRPAGRAGGRSAPRSAAATGT